MGNSLSGSRGKDKNLQRGKSVVQQKIARAGVAGQLNLDGQGLKTLPPQVLAVERLKVRSSGGFQVVSGVLWCLGDESYGCEAGEKPTKRRNASSSEDTPLIFASQRHFRRRLLFDIFGTPLTSVSCRFPEPQHPEQQAESASGGDWRRFPAAEAPQRRRQCVGRASESLGTHAADAPERQRQSADGHGPCGAAREPHQAGTGGKSARRRARRGVPASAQPDVLELDEDESRAAAGGLWAAAAAARGALSGQQRLGGGAGELRRHGAAEDSVDEVESHRTQDQRGEASLLWLECGMLLKRGAWWLRWRRSQEGQPIPEAFFEATAVQSLELEGNPLTKEALMEFDGIQVRTKQCFGFLGRSRAREGLEKLSYSTAFFRGPNAGVLGEASGAEEQEHLGRHHGRIRLLRPRLVFPKHPKVKNKIKEKPPFDTAAKYAPFSLSSSRVRREARGANKHGGTEDEENSTCARSRRSVVAKGPAVVAKGFRSKAHRSRRTVVTPLAVRRRSTNSGGGAFVFTAFIQVKVNSQLGGVDPPPDAFSQYPKYRRVTSEGDAALSAGTEHTSMRGLWLALGLWASAASASLLDCGLTNNTCTWQEPPNPDQSPATQEPHRQSPSRLLLQAQLHQLRRPLLVLPDLQRAGPHGAGGTTRGCGATAASADP
eukprot:scaffold845_cov231-Pinguiococcus_pyrenoidosus.AAC.7